MMSIKCTHYLTQRIACCRKSDDIKTGENIAKLPRVYILLGGRPVTVTITVGSQ